MSIIDTNSVDAVAISYDRKGIKLIIEDYLGWEHEYNHLMTLQDKVNAYVSFFVNKEYDVMYKGYPIEYGLIEVQFKYEPTEKALQFIEEADKQISNLPLSIEYRVMDNE